MKFSVLIIKSLEELLSKILKFTCSPNKLLSNYFCEYKKLGIFERNIISKAVYNLLYNKSTYFYFIYNKFGDKTISARNLTLFCLKDLISISSIEGLSEKEFYFFNKKIDFNLAPPLIKSNFPEWLFTKLVIQYGESETLDLSKKINQSAPLDLRVNLLKSKREIIIKKLLDFSIFCTPTPYAPFGLRVIKKVSLKKIDFFKKGIIEIQDEGSQLLTHIIEIKRGQLIVDFCAGSGGKTLAIGALIRNTGCIYALDISKKKIEELKKRVIRSGLSNVYPIVIKNENDIKIKFLEQKAHRVLVDAPCSGLGTLRRNPYIKWYQKSFFIEKINSKQINILNNASKLVRIEGYLIYSTCSILKEENEDIVNKFIEINKNFCLISVKNILKKQKIKLSINNDYYLKLLTNIHNTDCFFAAIMKRIE
ncbi:RsmB/NOP family class I SAM-dependent RNA methyltransferase [Candidatus Profftella armatura (Diaphorina cf. continua)]|uniref:RsmB/NOP family class I SAM-dependent RNA methyltransferase n=1 Tax=Candidatus Profftella armatura (Diaphorina cf. continua) TaxID=2661583 RepID=A0A7R6VYU5_9PROT|nr:RsmB/NOP family class I SAM-dependent RNA methyltransferase [Candidatus Profftella armatura (Diaphorina cf. continua)]BCG49657.1 RsmB/NOP family class I SAM-dependent RNA methyltransferase [Candidatus Profftella armatura (Diaphorina cf. continua)]